MKVLIVGSQGFIGSHLQTFYKNESLGCDILENLQQANFKKISSIDEVESIVRDYSPEVVINCSGAADVQSSLSAPVRDFELNTLNVMKILSYIRSHSPKAKFLNLSSAAVYGNPKTLPIKESADLKPLSPYGYHKFLAEKISHEYFSIYGIQTINLRIFSCYGPGIRKQIFWDTYKKSLADTDIVMHGTGLETRDFIHVADLCKVVDLIIKKHPFDGTAINVANGIEITIDEVSDLLLSKLNWKGNKVFNMISREGDPKNWRADISKLKSMGYEPSISIEKGILSYVSWLKDLG